MQCKVLLLAAGLLAAGCASRDTDGAPSGDGAAAEGSVDGALSSCTYHPELVCWNCGPRSKTPNTPGVAVGCTGPKACKLFCTDALPTGYSWCDYRGSFDAPPPCRGWEAPHPPFSSCKKGQLPDGRTSYACPSCVILNMSYSAATSPDGTCYIFSGGCIPDGFKGGGDCYP